MNISFFVIGIYICDLAGTSCQIHFDGLRKISLKTVYHYQGLSRDAGPKYHLIPLGITVAGDLWSDPAGHALTDHRCRLPIECHSPFYHIPLFIRKFRYITRQAHPAKKCIGNGIANPFQRIVPADHRPDLALARKDGPVQIRRNNRYLLRLVGVGEGCHRTEAHHQRFQLVSAGGAVLQYKIR